MLEDVNRCPWSSAGLGRPAGRHIAADPEQLAAGQRGGLKGRSPWMTRRVARC
jgi:hypothetical protein